MSRRNPILRRSLTRSMCVQVDIEHRQSVQARLRITKPGNSSYSGYYTPESKLVVVKMRGAVTYYFYLSSNSLDDRGPQLPSRRGTPLFSSSWAVIWSCLACRSTFCLPWRACRSWLTSLVCCFFSSKSLG